MKILVSGWYGFGNVGDEAILRSMILTFNKTFPNCSVSVLSFNASHTEQLHHTSAFRQIPMSKKEWLFGLTRGSVITSLRQFHSCDVFVMGGGGFLSDWQKDVPWSWLKQMLIAKFLGKKTMLYGIGAGPFFTQRGQRIVKTIINHFVDVVTVRDEASRVNLIKAGVEPDKVHLTADPVVSDVLWQNSDQTTTSKSGAKKRIGLILAPAFNDPQYWKQTDKFESLTTAYEQILVGTQKLGYDIDLIPFQPDRDEAYIRSLVSKTGVNASYTILADPETVASHLRTLDAVVSVRLHGCILAASVGVPFVGIVYHHKSAEFIKQVGLSEYEAEVGDGTNWKDVDLSSERVLANLSNILSNRGTVAAELFEKMSELKRLESRNAIILRDLVSNHAPE